MDFKGQTALVIDKHSEACRQLRGVLVGIGFRGVTEGNGFLQGLQRFEETVPSYVFFCIDESLDKSKEFLKTILKNDSEEKTIVPIICSSQLNLDIILAFVKLGAKGFLSKPYTSASVEEALNRGVQGLNIPDEIRDASDSNEAMVLMMTNKLDEAAEAVKLLGADAKNSKALEVFRKSANMAINYSKGGPAELLKSVESVCIAKSEKEPKTHLGKLRRKLSQNRDGGKKK